MNEEPEQVLVSPKGTKFVFVEGNQKAHIGATFAGRAFCGHALNFTQARMITCYENEVCSECLTAYEQLNQDTKNKSEKVSQGA